MAEGRPSLFMPWMSPGRARSKPGIFSAPFRPALPDNVPWALRDDSTGSYLDPEEEIGKQISPGSTVAVTPKTHLG
jgi:hypothetical protein